VPNPENYTITFNPDCTLNGKADSNTFTGTYSQENGFTITLVLQRWRPAVRPPWINNI
jgi:heat shock protein HslJ